MAVYVDKPRHSYKRMVMCHMAADTEEELHAMADKLGLRRQWFQQHPVIPHYDICKSKRKLALQLGAKAVSSKELVKRLRPKRK